MKKSKKIVKVKARRSHRVRTALGKGTSEKPRLSVFRSNTHIYAQLIDDETGKTVVSASSHDVKTKAKKADVAKEVGKLAAEKAKKAGISSAVFDRGTYKYHGRVKSLAEGAREGGLKF
jgi:large subunit ribosomal protein L18